MAYFHTTVLDNQIKALPTVSTASGSVATFDTDMTENLIEVVCDIQYSQASGTPTPSDPLPITTYTSLNLSHSGADTSNPTVYNIPFGQPVAKGTLNVTTGVLEITWIEVYLNSLTWTYDNVYNRFYTIISDRKRYNARLTPFSCSCYLPITDGRPLVEVPNLACYFGGFNDNTFYVHDSNYTDATTFDNSLGDNTICYPLQTPQVIQLDSTQIQALLNENNIWCDTNGNTSVKYLLTVGKAIS